MINNGDNCTAVINGQSEQVENTSAKSLELVLPSERSKNSNVVSECHDPAQYASSCQTLARSTSSTGKKEKSVIQVSISRSSELPKSICADNINAERPTDKHERETDSVMEDNLGPGAVTLVSFFDG